MGAATLRVSRVHAMLVLCILLPSFLPVSLSARPVVDGKLEGTTVPSRQMLGGHQLIRNGSMRRDRILWHGGPDWGHPVPINSARKTTRGKPGN
ncbi:hypothetical protein PAHAL_1G084700 [Panicum hallii]|uniref:Uncharacterized protein n=1 Tax=Panicum hallii TaxID=206008 RepID=A0A2S3GME6_9POAL|nr:hypothetical protein PAHAL_1G084700 [Panicum hallii]PAN04701.1 hypothetical protein PAHAL_1G084700 [Panicum hallii]PVH65821.1 hypothetical protein PAHAL_1G084700 [Panicum hallii]